MKREKLDMYVAPQDYILDAVKDPINLDVEQDIIGEIENFDSIEPTVFDRFTIKASPVEQVVFTGESNKESQNRKNELFDGEYLKWDEMEVGKTYRSLDHRYGWMLGNVEDFELSEEQLTKMRDNGWIKGEEVWVPDYEPFVLKSKGKYGDDIYFPSIDATFEGLVGDDSDEIEYEEVVDLKSESKNEVAGSPEEEKAILDECKKEFNELVKDAASITWQGPKFIDYTLLCVHCEDFEALNTLEAADLIEDLGFVVDRSYDDEPVFALDKSMSKEDLKSEIEKDAKANGYDISYSDESKKNESMGIKEINRLIANVDSVELLKDVLIQLLYNYMGETVDNPLDSNEILDMYNELSGYAKLNFAQLTNTDTNAQAFYTKAKEIIDKSKNERGGSDYGSFYNMFADKLQEEGYEGLKKIAWYCDLGTEFSGIANAIHEFRDDDYKAINKRAFKIFSAIDSMIVSYWDSIQGAALYFDSLGKQDNRFDNMLTDMLEDYSLGTPNIGSPNSIIDLVDDIVAELPKAIDMSKKGLNALYRTIDSITAPQGAIGTKKAIKVQLKAALDKEIVKANRIVALLKQEWPEGIQPQKRMFRGPQDADQLAYEIHQVLGEDMYKYDLGNDAFYITNTSDEHEFSTSFDITFYFHEPEGKVRVKATARPDNLTDDYTQEAVYELPTDINELAQNAIMLYNAAVEEMENDTKDESLAPYIVEPEKPSTVLNDSKFYIVQVLGKDGKWKTICKSLDEEYAYEIYDRWNERIESGDTSLATDISFSDPQELMYEAMEDFTYGK